MIPTFLLAPAMPGGRVNTFAFLIDPLALARKRALAAQDAAPAQPQARKPA